MRLAQLSCCQSAGDLVKFNSGLCVAIFFDYGNTNENINDQIIMYEGYSVMDTILKHLRIIELWPL